MTINSLLQAGFFVLVLVALVKPLGWYMAQVFSERPFGLDRVLGPLERLIYRACEVRSEAEMTWRQYAVALLLFHLVGWIVLYALLRLQAVLPLNPQGLTAPDADTAFNIATSFITNTNWQNYSGELTLSYLSQMMGLTVQNFLCPLGWANCWHASGWLCARQRGPAVGRRNHRLRWATCRSTWPSGGCMSRVRRSI